MSSIAEIGAVAPGRRWVRPALDWAHRLWRSYAEARQTSRIVHQLARMNPRLLKDMGFDPAEIRAAVRNSWDEIEPGRFHAD